MSPSVPIVVHSVSIFLFFFAFASHRPCCVGRASVPKGSRVHGSFSQSVHSIEMVQALAASQAGKWCSSLQYVLVFVVFNSWNGGTRRRYGGDVGEVSLLPGCSCRAGTGLRWDGTYPAGNVRIRGELREDACQICPLEAQRDSGRPWPQRSQCVFAGLA